MIKIIRRRLLAFVYMRAVCMPTPSRPAREPGPVGLPRQTPVPCKPAQDAATPHFPQIWQALPGRCRSGATEAHARGKSLYSKEMWAEKANCYDDLASRLSCLGDSGCPVAGSPGVVREGLSAVCSPPILAQQRGPSTGVSSATHTSLHSLLLAVSRDLRPCWTVWGPDLASSTAHTPHALRLSRLGRCSRAAGGNMDGTTRARAPRERTPHHDQ